MNCGFDRKIVVISTQNYAIFMIAFKTLVMFGEKV